MKPYIFLAILAALALSFSGCGVHRTHDTSKLPWARPAPWEQNNPQIGAGISY